MDDLPSAVLFDLLQDAAARLTGRYAQLHREAATAAESDAYWQKVVSVRERVQAIDRNDRPAMINRIGEFRRELDDRSAS